MRTDETPFEKALRHARENEARILQQRTVIARLERLRLAELAVEARRVLETMESNQRMFSARLRTVFDTTG